MDRASRIFTLQPSSGTPIYRQLINQVRRLVISGQLTPGTELPSVRDIALEYTVNPTTISKAYSLLQSEGLLQRNRGKPMTIAALKSRQIAATRSATELDAQVNSLVLAAHQLDFGEEELVKLIRKKFGENP